LAFCVVYKYKLIEMRLKKLEIKGFKSFADRTVLHFNDNITGIVGPNGCGKSNVVDAIRWVLGEQKTSQLRLEKMDNVLFNGCKTRKASGLAEVSLSFDNTKNILATEFTEVTISRKLFRSGESEYRINDVGCRLKDIQNLFIDSGIGSDSYAIIELGMVDEILQNRDHSRRRLFEQASSITKYKIRKKESLQKLKQTEENLDRLEDLLAEIQSNIKTLENQAKRAERYNQIREEYKEISLDIIKHQVKNYKENYNIVFNQKKEQEDNKIEIEQKIAIQEAEIQKNKFVLLDNEKHLTTIQKQYNELIGGIGKTENERNILKEQIHNFAIRNQELITQNVQLENELNILNQDLQSNQNEMESISKSFEATSKELEEKKKDLSEIEKTFESNKNILEKDKLLFQELQKEVFDLDKQKTISSNLLEQYQSQLKNEFLQIEDLKKQEEAHQSEFDLKNKEKERLDLEIESLQKWEVELNEKLAGLENQITENKGKVTVSQRKLDSKRNEYNLLKSMIDNLEGYPESIKHLKRNEKSFQDKMIFSDLIQCEEHYKSTVESIIAPISNYFIVENDEEAQTAILSLNKFQAGKSGFIVLDWIRKMPKPSFDIIPGCISALEIIQIENDYKVILEKLFSKTYVVTNDTIFDFNLHKGKDYRFVILENGKIIDDKFVFGGAKSLFDGAQVGRAKNAEVLKLQLEEVEKELSKQEKSLTKLLEQSNTIKELSKKGALENLFKEQKTIDEAFTKSKVMLEQTQQAHLKLKDQLKSREEDIKKQQDVLNKIEKTYKEKYDVFNEFKSKNEDQNAAFEKYLEVFNQQKSEVLEIESKWKTQQVLLNQKNEQIQFYSTKIDQIKQQTQHNTSKIDENQSLEKQKIEALNNLEFSIQENNTEKENFAKNIEIAEKAYYTLRGDLIEQEKSLKMIEQQKNQFQEVLNGYEKKIQEMRLNLQSIKERLDIEFKLDLNEFLNSDLEVVSDVESLESKQAHFRKRLETYGEVNPMAIETYKEVKERFDFLTTQKNDILTSKQHLINTIKEIDETAKDRFLESFYQVRTNFINTFRILFTEDDTCDLILVDPSNPIDSDIEIIAKPKGKKPLTINQLSGGEKTLTATALLFSLYLLKPAPFCIFDEVDAPLDDTNIAKFNKIIEEFSNNSQFIIVTHNKQTMASVEVLYGVTMIEQGVSKLVPVDFRSIAES
jgi:chromosome segregation protein